MKVKEFKKVEEGFFSDLARVGSDSVSSIPKPRVSSAEVQKRLLKDFIEDLLVDLDAAIKGGRVGVGISSAASANASAVQTSQQPAQPASTAQQPAQPQQSVQPTSATRQAAQQRSQQRKEKRQPTKPIDREEELAGVADLGYNESYSYSSFLNALVESYISEQQPEQQQMSIASWIMLWFAAYMKGVDWKGDKAGVETIAKEIESSYKKDRGKAAIQKLGSRAWDLIKTSGGTAPAGATQPKDDDLGTDIKTALSTQSQAQPDPEVENLKKALSFVSPEELATIRNELVKKSGTA